MTAAACSERVITAARGWIGTPYGHQASLKGVGCDCLGLVRGIWRELHGREPEIPPAYSPDWAEASGRETLAEAAGRHLRPIAIAEAAPGDVLLFAYQPHAPARHCAVQVAERRMIHAINAHPVAEVSIVPWWRNRLRFAFRFPAEI